MEVENGYIWKVAIIGGIHFWFPWLWQEGYTKLIPGISSVLWFFQTNGSNRHVMRSAITTQTKQRHFCGKQISFLNFPGFWVLCYLFSCITVGSAEPPAPTLTPGAWFAPEPLAQKMIDIWHWQSTCCLSIHQDSTTTWRCAAQILQFARLWIWKLTVKLRKSKPLPNFHISSTNHNLFLAWWKSCSLIFQTPGLRRLGRLSLRQVSWNTKKICDRFFSSHQQLSLPSHCCRSVLWGDPGHVTKANGDSDWQISTRNNPTNFPPWKIACLCSFLQLPHCTRFDKPLQVQGLQVMSIQAPVSKFPLANTGELEPLKGHPKKKSNLFESRTAKDHPFAYYLI